MSKELQKQTEILNKYFETEKCLDENQDDTEEALEKIVENCSASVSSFVISTRRLLHENPELMYQESTTSSIIQGILKSFGINFTTGWAKNTSPSIPGEGGFGIVADLGTGEPPCVLLRTDMDALPIAEETPIIDFKSKNQGAMHACGHDGHMAMLLGAAKVLKQFESTLNGTIRLMFQPAEEGGAGAKRMREEGVLDQVPPVQMAFGMHVWPTLPSGVIAGKSGAQLAASCLFQIDIEGVGGHAAMPHLTVDPIPAACALIGSLQTLVSRTLSPLDTGVLSITDFQAGDGAYNIIPKSATLRGTIRALSKDTLFTLKKKMEQMVKAIVVDAHACKSAKVSYPMKDEYPPTINDPKIWEFSSQVASKVSVEGAVRDVEPTMGAEDFAFIAEGVPSTFFFLGSGGKMKNGNQYSDVSAEDEKKEDLDVDDQQCSTENHNSVAPTCESKMDVLKTDYGLHHPKFALDEDVLCKGVQLHVSLALKSLKKLSE